MQNNWNVVNWYWHLFLYCSGQITELSYETWLKWKAVYCRPVCRWCWQPIKKLEISWPSPWCKTDKGFLLYHNLQQSTFEVDQKHLSDCFADKQIFFIIHHAYEISIWHYYHCNNYVDSKVWLFVKAWAWH